MTLAVNRKKLLMALLIGFSASNVVVGLSSSYSVIVFCRVVGGICAGILWPMIAAYGTRLVPAHLHGKAITVIMSGSTLGVSIGLPLMTFLAVTVHYAAYAYITLLVESMTFAGGINLALVIFGVGSIISVVLSAFFLWGLAFSYLSLLLFIPAMMPLVAQNANYLFSISTSARATFSDEAGFCPVISLPSITTCASQFPALLNWAL